VKLQNRKPFLRNNFRKWRFALAAAILIAGQIICASAYADVIVDNTQATFTGTWTTSTYQPNYYGTNYAYSASSASGASATWTPNLPSAGQYSVYYYLPNGAGDRAVAAQFTISYQGGSQTYSVNEQAMGGTWILLGTQAFAAGTSGSVKLINQGNQGYVIADAIKFVPYQAAVYTITNTPRQTILGLGVEIQNDSIGSGNNGLPDAVQAIPHDLVASERTRLYGDMLKGFRYARLAMGLYYRGLSADQKTIGPRYSSQNADLSELIQQSGIEGVAPEYWSPAPGWKTNNSYVNGGTLQSFDPTFLDSFGNNVVAELQQLSNAGISISIWGLQNEPPVTASYSSCTYTDQTYYQTFKVVAPKVRAVFPNVLIHGNSWNGQDELVTNRTGPGPLASDPQALSYLDAWTWHRVGNDSNDQISNVNTFTGSASGKIVFNNEFEYLDGQTSTARLVNTAQSVMNWMTFENAPTWFWLHALKPSGDSVAYGYGLGVWRIPSDTDFTHWPNLQAGYWDYIPQNYNALAGFLAYMPWNSVRYDVNESSVSGDRRVMAWKTPAGKLVFAVTNRTGADSSYQVVLSSSKTFTGHLYDSTPRNQVQADNTGQYLGKPVGTITGTTLNLTIPNLSIQFWVED